MEKNKKDGDVVGWCVVVDGEILESSFAKGRQDARKSLKLIRESDACKADAKRFKLAKIVISH